MRGTVGIITNNNTNNNHNDNNNNDNDNNVNPNAVTNNEIRLIRIIRRTEGTEEQGVSDP